MKGRTYSLTLLCDNSCYRIHEFIKFINTILLQTKKALVDEERSTDVHKLNTLYTRLLKSKVYHFSQV
jgi:hypothetical protein